MSRKIDSAIKAALGLDASNTTVVSHGGSNFSDTFKITTVVDGKEQRYFMKTSVGEDAALMFRGRSFFSSFW